MGTQASIAIKQDDKYLAITVNYDGYLDHTGLMLLKNYNSEALAKKLIELGDLSTIQKSCDKPAGHSFENRIHGFCVYYGRDREESGCEAQLLDSSNDLFWFEFSYLYEDGSWYVLNDTTESNSKCKFTLLSGEF